MRPELNTTTAGPKHTWLIPTMGIKHEWIAQDAWHRKDLDNGTYVICSRSVSGGWEWRHSSYSGRTLDWGTASTAGDAKRLADYTLNLVRVAA